MSEDNATNSLEDILGEDAEGEVIEDAPEEESEEEVPTEETPAAPANNAMLDSLAEEKPRVEEKPRTMVPAKTVEPPMVSPLTKDPYTFEDAQITIAITFLPIEEGQTPEQRRVILSVRSHEDRPLLKFKTALDIANGGMPEWMTALLADLRADLVVRGEAKTKTAAPLTKVEPKKAEPIPSAKKAEPKAEEPKAQEPTAQTSLFDLIS